MRKIVIILQVFICIACNKQANVNQSKLYLLELENSRLPRPVKLQAIKRFENNFDTRQTADTLSISTYYRLANSYWNLEEIKGFKRCAEKGVRLAGRIHCEEKLAFGYEKLAEYYGQPPTLKRDSAYYYLRLASDIYSEMNNRTGLAKINIIKASTALYEDDYVESEILSLRALWYLEEKGNDILKFECYTLLGINRLNCGNLKSADHYLHMANKLAIKRDDWTRAIALNNLGRLYLKQCAYLLAERCFLDALALVKETNCFIKCVALENLAIAKYKMNSYDTQAKLLFHEALKIKDSLRYDQVQSRVNFFEYHLSVNDSASAINIAKEAYAISKGGTQKDKTLALETLLKVQADNRKFIEEFLDITHNLQVANLKTTNDIIKINYKIDKVNESKTKEIYRKRLVILLMLFFLVLLIAIFLFAHMRNRRRKLLWLEQESKLVDEICRLMINGQDSIDAVRLDEKRKIARELHDNVMNSLTAIRLNLCCLKVNATKPAIKRSIKFIDQIQEVEQEIRNISHTMYYPENKFSDEFKILLEKFVGDLNEASGGASIKIHQEQDIPWDTISNINKLHIFRILQETVINAKKHSFATSVEVLIKCTPAVLEFEIKDNGVGLKTSVTKGMGWENVLYRCKQLNAQIDINSIEGVGTSLSFKILRP